MYCALKYIQEHLGEKITVENAAEACGYSKWHFCSLFREYTGSSFLAYVNHKKMQHASMDILQGDKVMDVAMKYGFDTSSGFNKAFLTAFGCYPKEFRNTDKQSREKYKERRDKMFPLSDRCAILRNDAVNIKSQNRDIAFTFDVYSAKGLSQNAPETSNEILLGSSVRYVAENAPPRIADGELIVGYNFGDCSGPGNLDGATFRDDAYLHMGAFTEEQLQEFEENRHRQFYHRNSNIEMTPCEKTLEDEWAGFSRCIVASHNVLNYQWVLEMGFVGLLEKVEQYEKQNGPSDLYSAAKMFCHAGMALGDRYAAKAEELLAFEASPERQRELETIRDVCRQVPRYPARTLWEAIQSLWFAHILTCWEDKRVNANSLGRLDQILYPYYCRDIEAGILTKEEAFELICCLWIKLYRDYDVQQSCVGGCKKDGSDAVNDLSYLMLDATEALDFIRCLSVRFSGETDHAFLKRAVEVAGHLQKGVPFFFNDEVMIPSLTSVGVTLEDARDYTQLGCVETVIPGKSNPHAVIGEVNFLKAVEYTLNNGKSMTSGAELDDIAPVLTENLLTYEDLERETYRYIKYLIDISCRMVKRKVADAVHWAQRPYKSLLTEGCIEQNLDFNNRGAKYDYYQVMFCGIPNFADSLVALKKLVFEEKKYTLAQLVEELKQDFPHEDIRLDFLNNAPKFGNDIDEVDDIAAKVTNFACDCLEECSRKYGLDYHAQPFTFLWMIDHGRNTAATPDGRRLGDSIAYSVSPMQGRDFEGLTAVFNSIIKFPTTRTPGTTSAIVEVDPKLFSDRNTDLFASMMLALAKRGLSNVQYNITDAEILRDAQKNPEKHRNLAVRVSGFSQKFYLLNNDLQEHIIERTKHKCL